MQHHPREREVGAARNHRLEHREAQAIGGAHLRGSAANGKLPDLPGGDGERGVEPEHLLPVAAHEEELIALREFMLDERGGQRREQVLIDRTLQRPGAHRR